MEPNDLSQDHKTEGNNDTAAATAIAEKATNIANQSNERVIITEFTGEYMNPVKRVVTKADPSREGATLRTTKVLEGPTGLVLQEVVGKGTFDNTKEPYISVNGQFAPGKTCRVTFSAQNAKKIADLLRGNVDSSSGVGINGQIHWPLKKQIKVTVFGTKMRGFALLGEELYLHEDDNKPPKVIIGAPVQENSVADDMLL